MYMDRKGIITRRTRQKRGMVLFPRSEALEHIPSPFLLQKQIQRHEGK